MATTYEAAVQEFTDDLENTLRDWAHRVLADVGEQMMEHEVNVIQEAGNVHTGDLLGSIGYATSSKQAYHGEDPKWEIDAPSDPLELRFGTKCPYAYYVIHGVPGYSKGGPGPAGGAQAIREWALAKGFSPQEAGAITGHILREGTDRINEGKLDFEPAQSTLLRAVQRARRREPMKVGRRVVSRKFVLRGTGV